MNNHVPPGYKLTEVGEIPEEWEVACVGDSFEVCNELRLPISQAVRERIFGQYPYYGPTNVQGWINEYRVEGEYALIGEDGDHFLKWKNQPMTLLVRGKFNVNNHAHLVRGTKNRTEWFYWFFANRDLTSYLTRQGASRYKLTKAALIQIPCILPPLPEQHAIAEALGDIDALLGGLDRLIAKKRDLKQAAMQQLLTGQTRLPGFHGEWEVKRLGSTATLKARIGWQGLTTAEYLDTGDFYLATGTEFKNGYIDWNSCHYVDESRYMQDKYIQLKKHDVLVTKDGTIGKVALITDLPKPATLNSGVFVIRPIESAFHPEFFYYLLCSTAFKEFLTQLSAGSTINHLYQKDFVSFTYRTPPSLAEQTAIAAVLSDMDAELATLEARRDKTRALKQAMMQELLTGKTRLI
jgi:type I restriction enzyme, S subunit